MKTKKISKKLSFKKETITNLETVVAGAFASLANTKDYSQCGTGAATLVPCLCPDTKDYSQCGTGAVTLVPCMC
jgi:hypothetical protein